jgi:hypothetical protein
MSAFLKVGSEFRVDTPGDGAASCPSVSALLSGGFVVGWTENIASLHHAGGPDIKARFYSSSGRANGPEFFINRETFDYQQDPSLAALPNGGFVAVWQDFSGRGGDQCGSGIKARVFGPRGEIIRNEFLVNEETKNSQTNPVVAALSHGGFVVAWQDFSGTRGDDSLSSVKARLFNGDGSPCSEEFLVNTHTNDNQMRPSITALSGGGFVVVWNDFSGTLGDFCSGSIKAKVFGSTGETVGEELLVNSRKWNNQNLPAVSALESGGFVVAWTDASRSMGDSSATSIKARLFDDQGRPTKEEFLVNSETLNTQIRPSVASLTDGGFVVAWVDYSGRGGDASASGIKAKVFTADAEVVHDEFLVNTETIGEQIDPTATGLTDGGFVVCWQDRGISSKEAKFSAIKGQIFGRAKLDSNDTSLIPTVESSTR